ncbi:MAG: PD-(D/E)XK nuclease family protein, partial [Bdellovibrionales bacterium]|nr:PD-(D/E)XK nuclease family protein [Bdellovibrionales bacterium]
HVLVVDCGKAPQLSGGASEHTRIHIDEHTHFWSFALPTADSANKEKTIIDYNYLDEIKMRELQESDRLFYVALTRAVKNLYISWQGDIHEDSWLGRSSFRLVPGINRLKKYSYQFQNVEIADEGLVYKNKQKEQLSLEVLNLSKLKSNKLRKISVTRFLDEFNSVNANTFASSFTEGDAQSQLKGTQVAQLGSDFHLLFEKARYAKSFQPREYIQKYFSENLHDKILKAFHWVKELNMPPMQSLLSTGYVEWGFQWQCQDLILEGQIDIWGNVSEETWLIDYKSGSSEYVQKAMQQLDLYSLALYEMGYNRIKKAVLFPFAEKVVIEQALNKKSLIEKYFKNEK